MPRPCEAVWGWNVWVVRVGAWGGGEESGWGREGGWEGEGGQKWEEGDIRTMTLVEEAWREEGGTAELEGGVRCEGEGGGGGERGEGREGVAS